MAQDEKIMKTCTKCKLTFEPSFSFDFYGDDETGVCENCMMSSAFQKPDPANPPQGFVDKVCKRGKGAKTCCFLGVDPSKGGNLDSMTVCFKNTSLHNSIVERQIAGTMTSKGDNCSGVPFFEVSE